MKFNYLLSAVYLMSIIACKNSATNKVISKDTIAKTKNNQEKNAQQLERIDSLIHANIKSPLLWNKKASLYLKIKKKDSAIYCYEKSIEIDIKNLDATIALAYLYSEKKNAKAIVLCQRILKTDKDLLYPKAHYIQGVYFANVKNIDKAIHHFNKCIQLDWTFIDAYFENGILLLQNKRNTDALKIFTLAMKSNNKNPEVYYWLGRTYETLNEKPKAILFYKQALLLDKNFAIAQTHLEQLETNK